MKIINTAKFLKLPIEAQNLYFHLGLRADDDGIVEAFPVMRMLSSSDDTLILLHSKEFIRVLNDDFITYIVDWLEHNNLRADRKTDSIYKNLLVKIMPNVKLLESKPRTYPNKDKGIIDDGQMSDQCQTNDGQMSDQCQSEDCLGEVRLGKDRLGKDRLGNNQPPTQPSKDNEEVKETLEKIFMVSGIGNYPEPIELFMRGVIRKMWEDRTMPLSLKIGLTHEQIRDCLRHVKLEHIDTAMRDLEKCKKNKKIYFAKALISAITENGIDETFTEEG